MGIEIERKFLVKNTSFKEEATERHFYKQGYIYGADVATVRIRIIEDTGFITIKSKAVNFTRYEYEYEIPLEDAQEMHENLCGDKIEKYRYIVWFEGKRWEVDEFLGENEGLLVAELELDSEDESFSLPEWAGKEVTHDHRYGNSYISQNPYKDWK